MSHDVTTVEHADAQASEVVSSASPLVGVPQVSTQHYVGAEYDHLARWSSYWHQIAVTRRLAPKRVLEIGKGTGLYSWYLREQLGIEVVTADFDAALEPDVVADVRELDKHFSPGSFDMVCAYQVLEHLPFQYFEPVLRQFQKVAAKDVVISLPSFWRQLALGVGILEVDMVRRLAHSYSAAAQVHSAASLGNQLARLSAEADSRGVRASNARSPRIPRP